MKPLRLLMVEDDPDDEALVVRALTTAGFDPDHLRVDTEASLAAALNEHDWQVILSDFSLPGFSGEKVLEMVRRERRLDTPFIFVSGAVGEETAARLMRAGAHDLVLKGNLSRLSAAIERELDAANDRNERRSFEAELEMERELLHQLMNNIPDSIFFKDKNRRFTIVNNTNNLARLKISKEEMIGRTIDEFIEPEVARLLMDEDERVFGKGEVISDRIRRIVEKDGTERWLSATKAPIRDRHGEIIGLVGITRDVTKRQQFEERLRQAQKMEAVGELTGGVAHDFNNLLMVVIGNLELLGETVEPNGSTLELVDECLSAALAGADLTKNLLAFSRRQPIGAHPVNITKAIESQIRLLQRTVGAQVELEYEGNDEAGLAIVDPTQMQTAVTNLVLNARDAMADGGSVKIRTFATKLAGDGKHEAEDLHPGAYFVIEVSDTGTGIRADVVERLFEPFFTTKEGGKGSGLGLAMVYGFAKQSGGKVTVESTLGEGSTFRIFLPQMEDEAVAARSPSAAEPEDPPVDGRETILVVDDNCAVRKSAVAQLQSLGYQTLEAGSGNEALAMIERQTSFDLLFTDVMMPGGMNGVELARAGRKVRPDLKVLLMSGFPGTLERNDLSELGNVKLLMKPYRRQELQDAVGAALGGVAKPNRMGLAGAGR